jgi:hypothetical protein
VTNDFQRSLTFLPPLIEDQPFFAWLTGKYALVRQEALVFSGLMPLNLFGHDGESSLFVTIAPLLDIVFGDEGRGVLTFGLTSSFLLGTPENSAGVDDFTNTALVASTAIRGGPTLKPAQLVARFLTMDHQPKSTREGGRRTREGGRREGGRRGAEADCFVNVPG